MPDIYQQHAEFMAGIFEQVNEQECEYQQAVTAYQTAISQAQLLAQSGDYWTVADLQRRKEREKRNQRQS